MRKRGKFERVPVPAPSRFEKMKKRTMLQSYMISLASLILCGTMLMGTTVAWFTSEVTSRENQMQVGTLEADVFLGSSSLKTANVPVFGSDITWIPNHVAVRTLTVTDQGQIPFRYELGLFNKAATAPNQQAADESVWNLFHVYVKNGQADADVAPSALVEVNGWKSIGTLAQIFNGDITLFEGDSSTVKQAAFSIAIHMDENAKIDYQGYQLSFGIKMVATQLGAPVAVKNQTELKEALASGGNAVFTETVVLNEKLPLNNGTLDGGGFGLRAPNHTGSDCAITTTGGTVKNVTISGDKNGTRAIGSGSSGDTTMTDDLYIDNVYIDGVQYAINGSGDGTCKVVVTDSTIYGWSSYSNITSFDFVNCTLGMGNSYDGYLTVYGNTSFTDCKFEGVFDLGARAEGGVVLAAGKTITFTNCTYDGVKVTADNFVKYFFYGAGDERDFGNLMRECTIIVDGVKVDNSAYVNN